MKRLFPLVLVVLIAGPSSPQAADGDADDKAIRDLIQRFYAAYAAKDLDAFMALWSQKSPDYDARKKIMAGLLAGTGPITVKGPTVIWARRNGDAASMRVRVELKGDDAKTGKPHPALTRLDRVIELTREGGRWKATHYGPSDRWLMEQVVAARTRAERLRLLDDDSDLVGSDFTQLVRDEEYALAEQGQFDRAAHLLDVAFEVAEGLGDRDALAWCHLYRGQTQELQARYEPSLASCEKALGLFREANDREGEGAALNSLGIAYKDTGRYADALRRFQDSLTIERELQDRAGEATTLGNIGIAYAATDRYTEALRQYQDSLTIVRDLADRAGEARTLNNIGLVYAATGRYDEALQQYQNSLKITHELNDRAGDAKAFNNIGMVYEATGRYDEALRQFQASLTIKREQEDRAGEARTLSNMGLVYADTGRYGEALRQYQDSLTIQRELGDRAEEARTLISIGMVYDDTGRYAEALQRYQNGLKIYRDLGIRTGVATTLGNIGVVYAETGRDAEALQQYQRSLTIERELKDRAGEARSLNNLGIVYRNAGRYADALSHHQAAREIALTIGDRAGAAKALNNLGIVYKDLGRSREALVQYQESLKIFQGLGDRAGEASSLGNIGAAYFDTKRYAEAREQFKAALDLAEPLDFLDLAVMCHGNLGRTYQAEKKWSDAVGAYREAVRMTERLRTNTREPALQTSLLAQRTGPFFGLAQCQLELDRPADSFAAGEQMKARGLVDILQQGKADPRRGMNSDERQEEQGLQERTTALAVHLEDLHSKKADAARQATLARDLTKARQDLEDFHRVLYLHRPDLAARRAEFAPISLMDLGDSFAGRPGLVVLSYLIGEKETLLFVLTAAKKDGDPARLSVHRINVESKDLAEAVDAFRDACTDPGKGEPDADDLYRWLLAPAAGELADAKQLVVIPDGVLHTLPFQAVKDSDGKYLIERFAVSYAPSVTALTKMEELGATRRKEYAGKPATLLAVGISDFGHREKTLPAAEKEAMAVVDAFGDGAKLLPGKEATRPKLLASWSGRRYLHFATHGRLNSDAPLYSSLVLSSSGDGDEGVLYARDLVDGAEIPAELAVMSACQTGLGKHVNGEGLQGLSWSWFTAGVPSTVASQWSVGDDSTARLMKVFYARLKAGDTKAEALRQAALALLQDDATRHPFYWAPFVLVGDDR